LAFPAVLRQRIALNTNEAWMSLAFLFCFNTSSAFPMGRSHDPKSLGFYIDAPT
jgi:hypothetical protein